MERLVIIGGGPAGMMAALRASSRYEVHLFEEQRSIGRKFLVAGKGGFNLTNQLDGEALVARYTPAERLRPMLEAFGSTDLRAWLASIGIPTYIGSSGRVFPDRGIKPIQVLEAIKGQLEQAGVLIHTRHEFTGFDENAVPIIQHEGKRVDLKAHRYFFALGGASWPSTGSTGEWVEAFRTLGVKVEPFGASNCGVEIDLPHELLLHAGKPLKNIAVACNGHSVRGECLLTGYGLEGNAIYPIVPAVREELEKGQKAVISMDLKPDMDLMKIATRLRDARPNERASASRLDRPAFALLKAYTAPTMLLDPQAMARSIKGVQIPVRKLRPLKEAISSIGGISWHSLENDLSLKGHPHLVVMGEMVDWDAPTGGFLLQGCFATGNWAAIKSP